MSWKVDLGPVLEVPESWRIAAGLVAGCIAGALALAGCTGPPASDSGGEQAAAEQAVDRGAVDFSFVFIGCNRVGWDPSNPSPSTANVAQLKQTFEDVANLPSRPRFLFFVGDLVRNEQADDGRTVAAQLAAWQELWEDGPLAGSATELVPLPGNHEVLASIEYPAGSGTYAEIPNPAAYDRWLTWLADHGHDRHAGNGPTATSDPGDQLARDSSQLTYSFSTPLASGGEAHFVLVDTDALSTARPTDESCLQDAHFAQDPVPGWIAADWIAADLQQAGTDPATELIFAIGHKPIQAPGGSDTQGRDNILNCEQYPLADRFLGSLAAQPKVVAYLTSHDHLWDHAELSSPQRSVPQVIAGDGGSPLSGPSPCGGESQDIFGFTEVTVYTSGEVVATSYGRPTPDPYDSLDSGGPAKVCTTVVLRPASPLPGGAKHRRSLGAGTG
jgi:hypothetical protein